MRIPPTFLPACMTACFASLLAPFAGAQDFQVDGPCAEPASLPAMGLAPGNAGPTVLLTNIAGHPLAEVPGLAGVQFDPHPTSTTRFDRPYGSLNGHWVLAAHTDLDASVDEVVIVDGMYRLKEGDPAPWAPSKIMGGMFRGYAIDIDGRWLAVNQTDGPSEFDQYLIRFDGSVVTPLLQEGATHPAIPGLTVGDQFSDPVLASNGAYGLLLQELGGATATTDEAVILGSQILLRTGSIPAGQANGETRELRDINVGDLGINFAGWRHVVSGDLVGNSSTDEIVLVDGQVVSQEGYPVPNSSLTEDIDRFWWVGVDPGGSWYIRGQNDGGDDWVVRNGTVVGVAGGQVPGTAAENWAEIGSASGFFLSVGNSQGDWVLGGITDNPDTSRNAVLILNGAVVVCREGDPLDLDGNGIFDDDTFLDTFGDNDAFLTDELKLHTVVTVKNGNGARLGQAFLSMDLSNGALGSSICIASPNSTGSPAFMQITGSRSVAWNDFRLRGHNLPPGQFGFFFVGDTIVNVPGAGNSNGVLCVGGTVSRLLLGGGIVFIGASGVAAYNLDLPSVPLPLPAIAPGQTRYFQCWYRDNDPGPTSNFTDGYSVTFLN